MNLIIIILAILLGYVYCYFIFPTNISIIQSSLEDFDFHLLLKRQPLMIEDKIKDIIVVLNSWFSSNIIQDIYFDEKRLWNLNSHKYLYCYALSDAEILLYPPGNKVVNDTPDNREPVIGIPLKAKQSIIIPFRWYYNIKNNQSIKLYGIHDYVTYTIDMVI